MAVDILLPLPEIEAHARAIAACIQRRPDVRRIAALMSRRLSSATSPRDTRTVLRDYFRRYGACTDVQPLAVSVPNWGRFELTFSRGFSATLDVCSDPHDLEHVEGLSLGEPRKRRTTLEEIRRAIDALPGRTAWQLAYLGGGSPPPTGQTDGSPRRLAGDRDDTPLAVGSAAKLYLLGALVQAVREGHASYSDALTLQAANAAIPSGMLQAWPSGLPMTVQSLAALAISISDNTATDHLLAYLGRERIEQMLHRAGHARPELDTPFLSVMEMMALKHARDERLTQRYLESDVEGRRRILAAMPPPQRQVVLLSQTPRHVGDLEWFASPADLCRCMHWLLRSGDRIARDILAINSGTAFPARRWPYVGFKGGSEPGVVNATYLLRDHDAAWYALSIGWNRDDAATDEKALFEIVRDIADLAPGLRSGTAPRERPLWKRLLGWR